ncbi:MAG: porin [Planctomycetota bacterium]|nr:porin [Planctomycetota bacterium]
MKKFAYGALALAAVGAAGQATDTGWSGLDQEINSLSASLATQNATGPKVGGFIITSLDYESNPPTAVDNNNDGDTADAGEVFEGDDVLGWNLRNARLEVKGDLGHDYSYKLSIETGTAGSVVKDAYVDWKITDGIKGRWGRYKVPFARSGLISDTKLLFLQRTQIGDKLGFRDLGASVSGQFEMVNFWVNAQNGTDGIVKDMFYNARVTFDVMGDGVAMLEGAYGAGDAMGLTIGGSVGDDSGLDNGVRWLLEAALTSGPFSVSAEIADFDKDIGDNTPWDATASFMFTDQYEVAARYEDLDDADNSVSYSLGVNRYVAGHDIKWTLQYVRLDTDREEQGIAFDRDQVALGLTVAF